MNEVHSIPASGSIHRAGGGYTSWCLALLGKGMSSRHSTPHFPLRGHLAPVSDPSLGYQTRSIALEKAAGSAKGAPTRIRMGLYRLIGADGPLPLSLSEMILTEKASGGNELHAFLDMLNLRIWELMFLRDVSGHDPRYIGFSSPHAHWLDQLTYAMAQIRIPEQFGAAPKLHRTVLQQGFIAGRKGGDATNLSAVMGALLQCKVSVKRNTPLRLPVATRTAIGRRTPARLGGGASLGAKTWVASGTDVVLRLNTAPESPAAFELLLKRAGHCVELLFGALAPLAKVSIEAPPSSTSARLGQAGHRLGRLASLGRDISVCRTVRQATSVA